MYKKYRVFVKTSRGSWFAAASDVLNGLAPLVSQWLEGTSAGRGIYEEEDKHGAVARLPDKLPDRAFNK